MRHIVSFSGGKDSTALLFMMLDRNMPIDEVVFVDLGVEHPEMYHHIETVRNMIDVPFTVEHPNHGDFKYWMLEWVTKKGKHRGEKGKGWPNIKNKWCTGLKIDSINRGRRKNCLHYQGIAADETKRIREDENSIYPLVSWGVTERECLQYCYDLGFHWQGLYEHFDRVSCYLCPFQAVRDYRTLYHHFPERWSEMKHLDSLSESRYTSRFSIEQFEMRFIEEDKQLSLF